MRGVSGASGNVWRGFKAFQRRGFRTFPQSLIEVYKSCWRVHRTFTVVLMRFDGFQEIYGGLRGFQREFRVLNTISRGFQGGFRGT